MVVWVVLSGLPMMSSRILSFARLRPAPFRPDERIDARDALGGGKIKTINV